MASMSTSSDHVRADAQRGGVADDRRGGGGVGAAVQDDPALHVGQLAVARGPVLVVELRRVAVDVPEEGLEAVVDDLDGLAGAQGPAGRRGSASTGPRVRRTRRPRRPASSAPSPRAGRGRARSGAGRVEPLGGDVEVDAAVLPPARRGRTRGRGRPGPACRRCTRPPRSRRPACGPPRLLPRTIGWRWTMFGCGTCPAWWSSRFSWTRIASGAVAEASSVMTGSSL